MAEIIDAQDPLAAAKEWLSGRKPALTRQRRYICDEVRLVHAKDAPPTIRGYAAVFNQTTTLYEEPGFKLQETISPGTFKDTIQSDDVRALFNHDSNYILGRTKAETLTLAEDDKGLFYTILPPDTQTARDLMTSIKRGDITQSSFGFDILKRTRTDNKEQGEVLYTLTKVKLYDVSPVTFPAYPQTEGLKVRMFRSDSECVFCLDDDAEPITVPLVIPKPATEITTEEIYQRFADLKLKVLG